MEGGSWRTYTIFTLNLVCLLYLCLYWKKNKAVYTRPDTSLKIMEDLLVVRNFFFWHTKTHIWRENGLDNHIRGAHQAYKKGWW